MLSLIICSLKKDTPQWLKDNIQNTIGAEYEIIHIDNSESRFNMCSAYNEGVRRAKGEILCFMHEDIKYYSQDWGKKIESHMHDPNVSMLGVFGSTVVPSDCDFRFSGFTIGHLIQRTVRITDPGEYVIDGVHWDTKAPLKKVAMVDGCWFCMKSSLFEGSDAVRFDDKTFDSFHLYDCDICMQVNEKGKGIYVASDIILEHFSLGVFSNGYEDGIKKFFEKWQSKLPYCNEGIDIKDCQNRLRRWKMFYDNMLKRDSCIVRLRKHFAAKRAGEEVAPLTDDEKVALQELEFNYAKNVVKYATTFSKACKAFDVFPNLPLFGKYSKLKLMAKFFYYSCINNHSRKNFSRIPVLER